MKKLLEMLAFWKSPFGITTVICSLILAAALAAGFFKYSEEKWRVAEREAFINWFEGLTDEQRENVSNAIATVHTVQNQSQITYQQWKELDYEHTSIALVLMFDNQPPTPGSSHGEKETQTNTD